MKINKITSNGMVAVKHIEITTPAPITLVCGHNRAGKSSLRDGIYHAFTGKTQHDVLKKDYLLMLNRSGGNLVGYTYVDFDADGKAGITIPSGKHELNCDLHSAINFVLDPRLFARSSSDERRRLLFDLFSLTSNADLAREKLIARKCDHGKVDLVIPSVEVSFDAGMKYAAERVKTARADWKATTGEVYGEKKAEGWKAQKPEVLDFEIADKSVLADLDKEIEENNIKLGEYVAIINGQKSRNSELVRLRDAAEKLDRHKLKHEADKKELAHWLEKLELVKKSASGLTHGKELACPCCAVLLTFDGEKLIEGKIDNSEKKEAAEKIPVYQKNVDLFQRSVNAGERDIAVAEQAAIDLKRMEEQAENSGVSADTIASLKVCIESLKAERKELGEKIELQNKNTQLSVMADEKTKKAGEYHADVMAWGLIESALSPEGIPSELLSSALVPINDRITENRKSMNFPGHVRIADDMTVYEDFEKLYQFSSKATKFLIDSMIAEAISHVSGIKFFMVDEFDLLDIPSRQNYLNWLLDLVDNRQVDSVLLFGTLKKAPEGLPEGINVVWVQDGEVK